MVFSNTYKEPHLLLLARRQFHLASDYNHVANYFLLIFYERNCGGLIA